MNKLLIIALLGTTSIVSADIAIEGMNCPEGYYSGVQGIKNQQECIPFDKEAAARASLPKDTKKECTSKECLEKEDKFIKAKIEK